MKKALSILLALVMVIGVFPTFADTKAEDKKAEKTAVQVSASEKALEALKGYGAIKGDGTADPFKMESELKRQNAAVILVRLLGVENEAKATEVKEKPFTDLPNDDFYKSIIQYVKAKGIFKGTTSEKFGFNEAITAQQFATINLRALGYEVDTDEAYGKALEQAKKLGLLKDASALENNTKIMRKDVYVIMNNTLETPKKGGKKALKYELGYATEPKVEKLEVVDAMADGLKVLKVEFNKAVDEESLKTIEITDKDENDVKFEAYLTGENKVANLALTKKAEQNQTLKIVVKDVKTEDRKQKVEKFEKKVAFVDTERPSISSVEALNPREIVIGVSEPMNLESKSYKKIDEIKIDDKAAYAKVENNYDGKLLLTLYKPLKEGEHKVVIEGLKDFADLPSAAFEQDITVVDDKEAPAATEAKLLTSKSIKVTFNENIEKIGEFKVNGEKAKGEYHKKNNKKDIELTLSKELGMGAIVEVKVEYRGQKDIMNNEVKNWEKITFSVADDTDLPTAELKGFDKDNAHKVQIQFSKAMNKEGEFKLKDSKGKVVQSGKVEGNALVMYEDEGKKTVDKSVLVFELKELKNKDPKDYTLVLEKFKDATVRHNEMPKTEIEFKGKDTKAPKVVGEGFTYKLEGTEEHTYTIAFTEKMNQDTLKDKTNYTVDGKRLDQIKDSKIKVLEDGRKVQIIIKASAGYGSGVRIGLIGLKDENDQKLDPVTLIQKPDAVIALDGDVEVTRNDKNEQFLKVKFGTEVKILDASFFTLEKASLAFEGDIDNYAKEFTFLVDGFEFKDDISNAPVFKIKEGAVTTPRGTKNGDLPGTLKDGIAPRIALDKNDEKLIKVVNPKEIAIDFTETLKVGPAAIIKVTVSKENKNVGVFDPAIAKENKVRIRLLEAMKEGEEYTVSIAVKDDHGVESGIIRETVAVTSLADFDQTLKAKLEAGTSPGKVKVVIEDAPASGNEIAYVPGEFFHKVGEEIKGATIPINTNEEAYPGPRESITVYELKTEGTKEYVVKYVVLSVKGYVAQHKATKVELAGGGADEFSAIQEMDGSGNGDFTTSVDPQIKLLKTAEPFDATHKKFKIDVQKSPSAPGTQEAVVVLSADKGVLKDADETGKQVIENLVSATDVEVLKSGEISIVVILKDEGKAPVIYNAQLTIQ